MRRPLAAPRRPNAATVQRRGDLPKRLRPGSLGLPDDRRDAIGEWVSPGNMVRVGYRAGLGELGIAEGLSLALAAARAAIARSLIISRSRSARAACKSQGHFLAARHSTVGGMRRHR
jgi:hypothetical protein